MVRLDLAPQQVQQVPLDVTRNLDFECRAPTPVNQVTLGHISVIILIGMMQEY